jgi:hypothetical protein
VPRDEPDEAADAPEPTGPELAALEPAEADGPEGPEELAGAASPQVSQ